MTLFTIFLVLAGVAVLFGGVFGIDSTSQATDNRQTAGDNANLLHGNGTITEAGGLTVGHGARYNAPGSVTLGNNAGNTNVTYKTGKNAPVTINEGVGRDDLTSILGQVQTATGSQISALTDAISNRAAAQAAGNPAGVVAADNQAAAAALPLINSKWLWLVPAAVVLWLLFKK